MTTNKVEIGSISVKSDHEIQWSIEDFPSYTAEDRCYSSPRFRASGFQWYLRVCPKGLTAEDSTGWISLCLSRGVNDDKTAPISARFKFGVKKVDGKVEHGKRVTWVFEEDNSGYGLSKFMLRSKLLQRESEVFVNKSLTLTCTLWTGHHGSLDTLSRNVAQLFTLERGCDMTVQVKNTEFSVHRAILFARSPVLAKTLKDHIEEKKKKKKTCCLEIENCEPATFKDFLGFLYSGKITNASCNAFALYKIAKRYEVEDLMSDCLTLIMNRLSVKNMLRAVLLANQFDEVSLMRKIQQFFNKNYREIISTAEWEEMLKKHTTLANNLLKGMPKK